MADEKTKLGTGIKNFLFNSNPFNKSLREALVNQKDEIATKNKLLENMGIPSTEPSLIAADARNLTDIVNEMQKRVDLRNLQAIYLRNQFVFRGINKRASEMVTRGYDIVGEDQSGVNKCSALIKNSGGPVFLRQSSVNADVFGNSYWEKIPNKAGTEILKFKQIHPLTFGFERHPETKIIIMGSDKTPRAFEQKSTDPVSGIETMIPVPKDKIVHVKYNMFGDEFSGISTLQPIYDTTLRLMNMEKSAAMAAIKTANPITVLTTDAKSPIILAKWLKVIGNLTGQQQVSLGENQKLEFLSPGEQNFSDYSDYFLDSVVSGLEVPKAILLGYGGSNRAETITLAKEFARVIRDNQLNFEREINLVFEEYAELAGFKAPKFMFKDLAEDAEGLTEEAVKLFEAGLLDREEARTMIGINGPTGKKISTDGTKDEVKKADMESWHPGKSGSPAGSQKGEKKEMKSSKDSATPSLK